MKNTFTFVCLALFSFSVPAQATFQLTSSSGFYVTAASACNDSGSLYSGTVSGGFAALKLDATGAMVWSKKYASTDLNLNMVTKSGQSIDGGYYLFGTTGPGSYGTDCFLAHLLTDGTMDWLRKYSTTTSGEYDYPTVSHHSDGSYYITFSITENMAVIKTDINGNQLWGKAITSDPYEDKNPGFFSLVNPDGSLVTCGKADSYPYVVCIDANGDPLWAQLFNDGVYSHTKTIHRTLDGGYFLGGYKDENGFITKLDNFGNIVWNKTYSKNNSNLEFRQIFTLSNGNYLLRGSSYGQQGYNALLVEINDNGDIVNCTKADNLENDYFAFLNIDYSTEEDIIAGGYLAYTSQPFFFRIDADLNGLCGKKQFSLDVADFTLPVTVSNNVYVSNAGSTSSAAFSQQDFTITLTDYCVLVGVGEPENVLSFSISPNLAFTETTITLPSSFQNTTLILTDITGKEIQQHEVPSSQNQIQLNTSQLANGMYMVNVFENGKRVGGEKLMVQQ